MADGKNRKNIFTIVGLILIMIGLLFVSGYKRNEEISSKLEESMLEEFYNENKNIEIGIRDKKISYIAVLTIPKIKLRKGLVDPSSWLNNVDKTIEILEGSSMPEIENSSLFLASHSGNSKVSYFKNLNLLEISDEVLIDYNGEVYIYNVTKIERVLKTGEIKVSKNVNSNILVLITCIPKTEEQLVVTCERK